MIKVKEILNYQESQESKINEWFKDNPNIELIDIKYSVGCFASDNTKGWDAQEFSGVLIIYMDVE